jgi:hypothetical protein
MLYIMEEHQIIIRPICMPVFQSETASILLESCRYADG